MFGKRQIWRRNRSLISRGLLTGLAALCLVSLFATTATAQATKNGQVFDHWTVQCPEGLTNQARGGCFIVHQVFDQDQKPVMHVAIGYLGDDQSPAAIFTLPLGLRLPPGALMSIDDKEAVRLPFERCAPEGCKVQFRMNAEQVASFKAGNAGTLKVQDATGRDFDIPFSLKGFTAALNALSS